MKSMQNKTKEKRIKFKNGSTIKFSKVEESARGTKTKEGKIIRALTEQQASFLENYKRMTDEEMDKEYAEAVEGSLGRMYIDLERSIRSGVVEIIVAK